LESSPYDAADETSTEAVNRLHGYLKRRLSAILLRPAMKSGIDDLLEMVDRWKLKLHAKLKKMKPGERQAFWRKIHEDAAKAGLNVAAPSQQPTKHGRRTG
jgi:hypothetical protein